MTNVSGMQTTLLSSKGGKIAECFVNHSEKKQERRMNQGLPRSSESIQKECGPANTVIFNTTFLS